MNRDALKQRLASSGCRLAFDTNAVFDNARLIALCDLVAQLNYQQSPGGQAKVALYISAAVYCEKLFDLKQQYRDRFDLQTIFNGLQAKGLNVAPFEPSDAASTAQHLGASYPSTPAWHAAKRARCLSCVGLAPNIPTPGNGQRCGATVDWLIAGQALSRGWILVGDDTGVEWNGLECVKLKDLEDTLVGLLGAAP